MAYWLRSNDPNVALLEQRGDVHLAIIALAPVWFNQPNHILSVPHCNSILGLVDALSSLDSIAQPATNRLLCSPVTTAQDFLEAAFPINYTIVWT
jgi:hypothetical protein